METTVEPPLASGASLSFVVSSFEEATPEAKTWAANMLASMDPFKTLGRTPANFEAIFARPGYLLVLALVDGAMAGIAAIRPWGFMSAPYLAILGVAPEFRGGVGTRLLAKFESLFPDARHFFLCVSSFNVRAQAFYARNGYVQRGEVPDYIIEGHSELIMHKRATAK